MRLLTLSLLVMLSFGAIGCSRTNRVTLESIPLGVVPSASLDGLEGLTPEQRMAKAIESLEARPIDRKVPPRSDPEGYRYLGTLPVTPTFRLDQKILKDGTQIDFALQFEIALNQLADIAMEQFPGADFTVTAFCYRGYEYTKNEGVLCIKYEVQIHCYKDLHPTKAVPPNQSA